MICNESMEFTPDMDRRVVIDDDFYHKNASVFNRMGLKPQNKTYSNVVGSNGLIEIEQQHYPAN